MNKTVGFLRKTVACLASAALACALLPAAAFAAGPGDSPGGMGGSSGGSSGSADTQTFDYTGSYSGVIEADGEQVSASGYTYSTSTADVNVALAQNAGTLTLDDAALVKGGSDSDGDSCNFYGVNSILLSVNEDSTAVISDSALTASGEGSNGIFATDSATAYANNVSISTSDDNSRGLDATYSGTIVASNMSIVTQGSHCAGVATDRGGGSVSITSSTISTAGEGSPILYSTGDVEASGITGTATGSQLVGMEGYNTVLVNNSTLTSTITKSTASDPVADGVIIYQSTSGDADTSTGETATFQVVNSSLTSAIESGAMIFLTNTTADVYLQGSELSFDTDAADLILASGNDGTNNWGSAGSNGATVKVTASDQQLEGTIEADTISSVDLYLADGSTWEGKALITTNSSATSSSTVSDPLNVNVDATSTWVVTESCELSTLTVADGGSVVDADGNAVTVVTSEGTTVVSGSSSVTVTVGSYSTAYDESEEGTAATDLIDRSAFDETFGTSTSFAMGDATATGSADVSDTVGSAGEVSDSDGSDGDSGDGSDGTDSDDSGSSDGDSSDNGDIDSNMGVDPDTDGDATPDEGDGGSDGSTTTPDLIKIEEQHVTLSETTFTYDGSAHVPEVTVVVDGETLEEGTDYTLSYSSGACIAVGTYTVTVTGTQRYTGEVTLSFTIEAAATDDSSTDDGTADDSGTTTDDGTADDSGTDGGTTDGDSSTDDSSGGDSGTTDSGTTDDSSADADSGTTDDSSANDGSTASSGSSASTSTSVKKPAKVKLKSAKSKAKKRLTVKWKKVGGKNVKYRVAYRVKGSKKWKRVTVSGKKAQKTLKKLKSGKKYQVKVRAVKTVSGKAYKGKWSKTKTVKVK